MPLAGHYQPELVALSVVIAILAAGAALDLAGRVTVTRGRAQAAWLAGGAFAMGLGIWSMHYTGMLAFQLPVDLRYHVPTVLLSLLAAVLASGVALFLSSGQRLGAWRVAIGSVVMGSGIAAMHYIGMAAMRLPAMVQWRGLIVALSVAIAIAVSAVALWLAFRFGHAVSPVWGRHKAAAAIVMGLAISTMHYTGMAAARFSESSVAPDLSLAVDVTSVGVAAIVAATVTVLLLAIATSIVDRRISAEREHAAERQAALVRELQTALTEVKVLRGILPICATCKRVRTEEGGWEQIESYVRTHTNAEFSHGLCPECARATWGTVAS
jgi:two-component system, sensor histidine kinase and response regulator